MARTVDHGHGRLERRWHTVITDPDAIAWLQRCHAWPHRAAIGRLASERRLGSTREQETRYELLSRPLTAAAFGASVRAHWGSENRACATSPATSSRTLPPGTGPPQRDAAYALAGIPTISLYVLQEMDV